MDRTGERWEGIVHSAVFDVFVWKQLYDGLSVVWGRKAKDGEESKHAYFFFLNLYRFSSSEMGKSATMVTASGFCDWPPPKSR